MRYYFPPWNSYRSRTDIPRSEELLQIPWKPKWIPSSHEHKCSFDEGHTSHRLPNPHSLGDMDPAALKSPNPINDKDSISNQYPLITVHHPRTDSYPVFSSFQRWTVKWKHCASTLHSFRELSYRTDQWTKQLLRLNSLEIIRSPEQCMDFRRLWLNVIVFMCSSLIRLFQFFCCCCNISVFVVFFSKIYPFLFLFLDDSEWVVRVHRQFLSKVTLR